MNLMLERFKVVNIHIWSPSFDIIYKKEKATAATGVCPQQKHAIIVIHRQKRIYYYIM
jgi:hypothetical protein